MDNSFPIIRRNNEIEDAIYKLFEVKTMLLGGIPFRLKLSNLELKVITLIYLHGYSKELILHIAKTRNQTSEQSVRNTISNLIKSGYLRRLSQNNVIVEYDLSDFQ